jgi:hypothetical protein
MVATYARPDGPGRSSTEIGDDPDYHSSAHATPANCST